MPRSTTPPPAPNPSAPHRLTADERRAEIVEAAVKAFASGGLAGTPTEEIARLAGVSQPYLFRLFGTKRELFIAALGRAFDRVADTFTTAAETPAEDALAIGPKSPVLVSIARAYHALLKDPALLRLQLQGFAACDDPAVRAYVRMRYASIVHLVARLSDTPVEDLRAFFAEGTLMNVAAAMELSDADVAWELICEGGPA